MITLIDIQDFQKKIVEAFEAKGLLSSFENDIIPAPKKNMSVNEAKVKKDKKHREDSPDVVKAFQNEYKKDKISFKKDTEIQNEITSLATKLAEDPTKVILHKDIIANLAPTKNKSLLVLPICQLLS